MANKNYSGIEFTKSYTDGNEVSRDIEHYRGMGYVATIKPGLTENEKVEVVFRRIGTVSKDISNMVERTFDLITSE